MKICIIHDAFKSIIWWDSIIYDTVLLAGVVEYTTWTSAEGRDPHPTKPLFGCGWWLGGWAAKPKWSSNLQHSTLAFTGLLAWLGRSDQINRLVISSPITCMIVLTVFVKFTKHIYKQDLALNNHQRFICH